MTKKAIVILAEGFEDVEAVTPVDILRRAGVEVTVAGLKGKLVRGARGIKIEADVLLSEAVSREFDVCVLPGGLPGATNLAGSDTVNAFVKNMAENQKIIAAICAAPAVVLAPLGLLHHKTATCFPSMENKFDSSVKHSTEPVVVDGCLVTSRALGTALAFSFAIVDNLCGKEMSDKIRKAVLG